jgi:simple sugar transport system substrate-binding protein
VQELATAKLKELGGGPEATYPGPTEPFDPGTGKTRVMGCGFASTVCAEQARAAVEAVQAMGWESDPAFDGQNSPQIEAGFVDRAVQDGVDGIFLASVDVNTIKASVDRAIAAGMPIICTNCGSGTYNGNGVIDVSPNWKDQGIIAGWKILAERGENAKVVAFADAAFTSSTDRAKGLEETIKTNCPTCGYDYHDFPSSDYGKPGPPAWNAILSSTAPGDITDVQGHYDGLSMTIAKTNVQGGRTEISVGGYDGQSDALAALVSGDPPFSFTVAEPIAYEEWAGADLLARIKVGAPLWTGSDAMPSLLVTKENASELLVGNPAGSTFPAPTGDWQAEFKKLWGKS